MPSGFGGLTEGLWQSINEGRQESQRREEQAAQREAQILQALASNEDTDPEIRAMAVTGMLEMANPKRKAKGLRGFLGEMEASQTLPRIRQLMATPVETEVRTPGLPSRGVPVATAMRGPAAIPSRPPGAPGSAALPSQSPVEPRAQGPPSLPSVLPASQVARGPQPPPAPGPAFSEQRGTPTITTREMRPRQVFLAPDERLRRDTIAREQAEVEGEVAGYVAAGMSRDEALALVKQSRIRRGTGGTAGVGEGDVVPDPQSSTGFSRVLYDRYSGREVGRTPAMDPRRTGRVADLGDAVEMAAKRLGYNSSSEVPVERANELHEMSRTVAQEMSEARGLGGGLGRAGAPLTLDQKAQHTRALQGTWFRYQQPLLATRRALASLKAGMAAVERGDVAAGSEAVIVTFEKILDSLSVVRESEYLRPLHNQSLYDRVYGMYERLKSGGAGLPPEALKSYARLAEEIGGNVEAMVEPARQMLRNTALEFGLNPMLIVGADGPPPGEGTTPPPGAGGPGAAAPAAPKTTTMAQVRAYAAARGVSEAAALAKAKADGFSVTDEPR